MGEGVFGRRALNVFVYFLTLARCAGEGRVRALYPHSALFQRKHEGHEGLG